MLGAATGLVLGLVVLGPALAPGYTLHYDLVHVPDLGLGPRTLGTDGSVPRAVPNDLVVALLSLLLPGWLVQKAVLLGCLVVGGAGVGRLSRTGWGAVAGAALWTWNPWVGERLGIGHWGFLVGLALLPWVLVTSARLREGAGSRLAAATAVALAALGGSTAGVLATLLAVVVLLVPVGTRPRPGDLGVVLGAAVTTNAAWWWPFLVSSSRAADEGGAVAFASRADTPFGVLGSLLLGGGLWNDRTWFVERQSLAVAGLALALVVAVLVAALRQRSWWTEPATPGVTVAGVLGLLLAGLASLPGGERLLAWLVTTVPGAGLLRDGQKFVALWLLLVAVAVVALVDRVAATGGGRVLLVAAVLAPVATLPTLGWGHAGRWGSVDYPDGVLRAAAHVEAGDGPVAVLPWSTYRRYAWNGDRVVLDPWNRLVTHDVVSDDRLRLREGTVAGEDPVGARVAATVAAGGDVAAVLREAGVRQVVVQTDQPDPEGSVPDLGEPVLAADGVEVYALDGDASSPRPAPSRWVAGGLVLSGSAYGALLLAGLRSRAARRDPRHG